jgi:hypothetical protein
VGLGFSNCTGGSVDFFLPAPRKAQGALKGGESDVPTYLPIFLRLTFFF